MLLGMWPTVRAHFVSEFAAVLLPLLVIVVVDDIRDRSFFFLGVFLCSFVCHLKILYQVCTRPVSL